MKFYSEFLYAAVAFACRECTTEDSVLVVPHSVLSLALLSANLAFPLEPSDTDL